MNVNLNSCFILHCCCCFATSCQFCFENVRFRFWLFASDSESGSLFTKRENADGLAENPDSFAFSAQTSGWTKYLCVCIFYVQIHVYVNVYCVFSLSVYFWQKALPVTCGCPGDSLTGRLTSIVQNTKIHPNFCFTEVHKSETSIVQRENTKIHPNYCFTEVHKAETSIVQ